jgi:hypothetical protein
VSENAKPGGIGHNTRRPYYERYYFSAIGASEFGLSMSAVAVLRTLCLFANGTYEINEEGLAPGQTWVRARTLAYRAGCDLKTVFQAFAELENRGLLRRKERPGTSSILTVDWNRLEQAGIAVVDERRLSNVGRPESGSTSQSENGSTHRRVDHPTQRRVERLTRKRVANQSNSTHSNSTGVMGAPATPTARAAPPNDDPPLVRQAGKPSSRSQRVWRFRQTTDDLSDTQITDDFSSEVPELNGNTAAWAERLAGISEEPIYAARRALHDRARYLRAGGVDPKTGQYVEPAPGDAIGGVLVMGIEAIERKKGEPGSKYASVPASRLLAGFTRNIDVKAARARGTEPNHRPPRRGVFARRD